jgi:hypothetical protein
MGMARSQTGCNHDRKKELQIARTGENAERKTEHGHHVTGTDLRTTLTEDVES